MTKQALIIQHTAPETLGGNYTKALQENGFELCYLKVFESAPTYDRLSAPPLGEIHTLLILGGPFSANDEFPALQKERRYIKEALEADVPVFGICLGAQMMSRVLGGHVEPTGGYQFGLRKIYVTAEGDADPVFGRIKIPLVPTLHGDCFSIPQGGIKLAEGYMLRQDGGYRKINMAFRYKHSYGLQFEPQLTFEEMVRWNEELRSDYLLMGEGFDPKEEAARNEREFRKYAPLYETQMKELFVAFLRNAGLI